ncbi:MAG: endonuclease/exonuclease/phosphatase family protein [Bacteroidales bacterium]|jgi:endonuclease/exonuclease/phosphatase family metal-dependent hydrolase|nr:endonuclease/exonuclease/phosphatase family protein [Bacteroidales bacterium]
MKQKIISNLALVAALLLACKGDPLIEAASIGLSSETILFSSGAEAKTVTVKSNREFTATMEEYLDRMWCAVNVLAGETNNLSISVTANPEVNRERTAKIIVSAETADSRSIIVCQAGAEARLSVKEDRIVLNEAEGLVFSLEVTANIPVAFELPAWITRQSGDASTGGVQTHTFALTPLGATGMSREGAVVVKAADPSLSNSVTVAIKQSTEEFTVLRAASYNILVQNQNAWSARKAMVTQLIRTHDFDIFGVQEALKHQIDDILATGGYSYTGVGRDDGNSAGEHSAVIYKTDRFELLESGSFWYSPTPDVPGKGWDAVCCNRICSWGKFREQESGIIFYFFSSHFDHQGVVARNESARLLKEKVAAIAGNRPTIAVGDYNADPASDCIQIILNGAIASLYDSRARSGTTPAGTVGTYNGMSYTLAQMTDALRIDFIFVSNPVQVMEYSVLNDRPNGNYPSDHDPVLITAKIMNNE